MTEIKKLKEISMRHNGKEIKFLVQIKKDKVGELEQLNKVFNNEIN